MSGFICGAWKRVFEGPAMARQTYVMRCDLQENHDGEHVDSALYTNWRDDEVDPEFFPRNELDAA